MEEKDVSQFTVEGKLTKAGKIDTTTNSATTPASSVKRSGSFKSRPRGGSFRKRVNLAEKEGNTEEEKNKNNSKNGDVKSGEFFWAIFSTYAIS